MDVQHGIAAIASRILFLMNGPRSLTGIDRNCQLRWANKKTRYPLDAGFLSAFRSTTEMIAVVLTIPAIDDRLVQVFVAVPSVTLLVILWLFSNQSVAGEQQR